MSDEDDADCAFSMRKGVKPTFEKSGAKRGALSRREQQHEVMEGALPPC